MSDVFSEFRASLIGKEFENAALAWPAQAQPRFIAFICANPIHLIRYEVDPIFRPVAG